MSCSVVFSGKTYSISEFERLLNNGLLNTLVDRKVVSVPNNIRQQLTEGSKSFSHIFVENKKDVEEAMVKTFGLKPEEAKAVSEIYDLNATAWANRNNRLRADYFKTLTIVKSTPEQLKTVNDILNQEEPLVRDAVRIGYKYDTNKVARERFDIGKLTKIGSGSDRDVYDIGDNKVVKIAKTARGLAQNFTETDQNLSDLGVIPKVYETGLNYNVVEKVSPFDTYEYDTLEKDGKHFVIGTDEFGQMEDADNEKVIPVASSKEAIDLKNKLNNSKQNKFLRELMQAKSDHIAIAEVLDKYGIPSIIAEDYLLSVADFRHPNNWGTTKEGKFVHLDGGTFDITGTIHMSESERKMTEEDFKQVYKKTQAIRKKLGDKDDNFLYQMPLQARDALNKVITGFQLQSDPKAFGTAFRSKNQKASPQLASAINSFLTNNGIDSVKFVYEKTYGTVNAIVGNKLLYQDNSITIKNINSKIKNVTKNQVLKYIDLVSKSQYDNLSKFPSAGFYEEFKNITEKTINSLEDIRSDLENESNPREALKNAMGLVMNTADFLNKSGILTISEAEVLSQSQETKYLNVGESSTVHPDIEFDHNYDPILNSYLLNQQAQAAILLGQDGSDIIYALSNPNVSSPIHELAHKWERELNDFEKQEVLDWTKQDEWDITTSEKFARGFENYLATQEAPNVELKSLFDLFKNWLKNIYKAIVGSDIDVELNDSMKTIYTQMLGQNYKQAAKEELEQDALDSRGIPKVKVDTLSSRIEEFNKNASNRLVSVINKYDQHNKYFIADEMEKAYRDTDFYQNAMREGVVTVEQLRAIFASASLPEYWADSVANKMNNPSVKTTIENVQQAAPTPAIERVIINLVENGQIEFALKNDVVSAAVIEEVLAPIQTEEVKEIKEEAKLKVEEDKKQTEELNKKVEEEQKREYIKPEVEEVIPDTPEQKVEEPIEDIRPGLIKEEPKRKYNKGDAVLFRGEKAIVKGYDEDGFVELTDEEGGFKPFAKEKDLSDYKEENVKPQIKFIQDKENPSVSFEPINKGLSKEDYREATDKQNKLIRVAGRISKFLPSVQVQIGTFGGKWKGRIVGNTVQIDYKNADLGTPIHELMHPFVLAMRLGNPELYDNLIQELKFGQNSYYLDLVNESPDYANISENEREDEALVRYIGDEVSQVFDENGNIDQDVLDKKSESFIKFVYNWFLDKLRDIWGLVNDRITKTLSGEDKKSTAGRKGLSFKQFDKLSYDKETKTLKGYKPGSDRPSFTINDYDFTNNTELTNRAFPDEAISQMQAIFEGSDKKIVDLNPNDLILETVDGEGIKYYNTNEERYSVTVADIPANFTLQNLSDFIAAQTKLSINLAGQQQAIDKMEAYQYSSKLDAEEILKKLQRKLKTLEDTGTRRIMNSEYVTNDVIGIRKILRDMDGIDAVSEYIRFGIGGIENAANLIRDIRERMEKAQQGFVEEYDKTTGQKKYIKVSNDSLLDERMVNNLNRDLQEAISLVTFYDDLSSLKYYFADNFEKEESDDFVRVLDYANMRKNQISSVANDLVTEWLYPKLEESQANLPDNLKISKEQFKKRIRFADQNNSNITYWMGAVINSRDPLNAITAVKVKDVLNENHIKEAERLNDIRRVYDEFIKRTGTKNTIGALEKYYKDNFLRKAKIWEVTNINKETGEKTYGYVERWAYHEKYYWDLFEDDLRKYKESLPEPKSNDDFMARDNKISQWFDANHPEKTTKYLNKDFAAIQNDEYFQLLYNTYREGNDKYGERALRFGIVPQAYKKQASYVEKWKDIKNLPQYFKSLKDTKGRVDKAGQIAKDAGNYIFDEDSWSSEQDLNLDGTHYSGVKSPFTHLINQDDIDFRLNESTYAFYTTGNTFASLRQVQANVENLKLLINGNTKLGIEARKVLKVDKEGKIIFDRFKGVPVNDQKGAEKLIKQLDSFINDVFYGESEFETTYKLGPVTINANKVGRDLGFVTALYNMAGNVLGGVSNSAVGNVQSLGESVGGKYYNTKNWLKAKGIYYKAFANGNFLGDVINPVKSKITQLAIIYDAIQGEFRDKFGKNITGNVAQRYATGDSFFLINHVAEHEIQLTGFLALADATKVKLKDGSEVSLFDAYTKNDKGFYKLRDDAVWSQKDNDDFIKKLHGISKDLNGNYAAFDKSMSQRYWMGKLALQYRKYMYPAWRSRFASTRVDYERGEVLQGYYVGFMNKVMDDLKNYRFPLVNKQYTNEQAYAVRKTLFDVGIIAATYLIVMGLTSAALPDDEANKKAKQRLILAMLRLNSDISQYSITAPQEGIKTIMNPAASLQTAKNYLDFFGQLFTKPTEQYKTSGSGYNQGDTKLGHKFEKLIPLYRQYLRYMTPDEQIKYFSLINKDIQADNKDNNAIVGK